jgi:hypothetical protein
LIPISTARKRRFSVATTTRILAASIFISPDQ